MTAGRADAPRVTLDLQAAQSATYKERGVARHALDFAHAVATHPAGVLEQVLIRDDLPPVGRLESLVAAGLVTKRARWGSENGIFHALSPFDLDVPLGLLWPRSAFERAQHLVVTVYDLIPAQFPDIYLQDPGTRRRYQVRQQIVRAADHVMTLSHAVAEDVHEMLGVPPERISVVGAACAAHFTPTKDQSVAAVQVRALVPGVGTRTVVYNGAVEPRKNMERLLAAFARIPVAVRSGVQLVLVCRLEPLQRRHFEYLAEVHGVADQVLLTGEITDEAIVALYRTAELVVFPSFAEGYGLPVAEAMACGAPVVASTNPALTELVAPGATFDPYSEDAIAAAMTRPLVDPAYRAELVEWSARPRTTWADVAERAVEAYGRVAVGSTVHPRGAPGRGRRRPMVAVVTPWPPAASGVAVYSARLVEELLRDVDVEVFVEGDQPTDASGENGRVVTRRARSFGAIEAAHAGYDAVLVCIGNSEFHGVGLSLIREGRVQPVTLLHEIRLTELYRHAAARGAVPEGVVGALAAMYGPLPSGLVHDQWIRPDVAERHGIFMAREIIARSSRVIVTSEFAARLARMDAHAGDQDRIYVVPLAYPAVAAQQERDEQLIGSFGLVNEVKRPLLLVRALSVLRQQGRAVRLVFAGPVSEHDRREILEEATRSGVEDDIEITGYLDEARYASLLSRVALAVQLRAQTNGESSAAMHDGIASGVPLVVTSIGAARELPDFAEKVRVDVGAGELAALLGELLGDRSRRQAMTDAGLAYAASHDFAHAAALTLAVAEMTELAALTRTP
ncbi:MAG TPA: glycosyltransferase [Acidimicrobiales bacterium]|nr:glycosyltransferase [Acidimicrobiales bacterium]